MDKPRYRFSPLRKMQRGVHAVIFVVTALLLLFFVGLGMDAGRAFVAKGEMQNAADACALAAASALTGGSIDQLEIADAYGVSAGSANLANFQSDQIPFTTDSTVTFSQSLNGNYQTRSAVANPLDIEYAQCTVDSSAFSFFLIKVANALSPGSVTDKVVGARAIASLEPSISACAIPIGMCAGPGGLGAPNFGWNVGDWMVARRQPGAGASCASDGSGTSTGSGSDWSGAFRWIEFPGYARTKDLKALLEGSGECSIDPSNVPDVDSHNGQVQSLIGAYNSRFGVEKGGGSPGPPDFSGYAYTRYSANVCLDTSGDDPGAETWPAGRDAYDDFRVRRANNEPWNGVPSLGGGWSGSTTAEHANGADRRLVTVPVIDCPGIGEPPGSGSSAVYGFACTMLLNPVGSPQQAMGMEYRGVAGVFGSGCVTSGLPGGAAGGPEVPGLVY